ncbi:hypothetical protein [Enterococcus faecalis]|uniref:hypothetical protein n=1 Tax=Enterococcus faecalis TaxID=1351 RepID=UPI002161FC30|nr:hypothetical protein [Enterococcus faecalis]
MGDNREQPDKKRRECKKEKTWCKKRSNAKTLAVDKKVRPFLFKETATVTSPESVESLEVQREISINFWLYSGIFLGSIVILFVGVFLGNRFSYHRAQSGN